MHINQGIILVQSKLAVALVCLSFTVTIMTSADIQAESLPELGSEPQAAESSAAKAGGDDMEKIAKMTANPVGAAWMMWTQNDYTRINGDLVPGNEYVNSTKFQPVMSFPLDFRGEDWNLIVRPVLQYQSVPLDKDVGKLFGASPSDIVVDPRLGGIAEDAFDDRTSGFGDTALLTLLGPNRLDGNIWGVGMTQIFPTAEEDVLGQQKWQAGPAFLWAHLAKDVGGFNYGALAQHWWSYAGDDDRENTSQTDIQYFINYRLSKTELVGMTPNIRYNWEADDSDDKLTLPIGLGYSNVYKLGKLPVRIAAEVQYSVISPDNVGSDWNFRLLFIPVIPNPFR